MGIFSINQTEFTVQGACIYILFYYKLKKKIPWLQLQLISSHIWWIYVCPISTKFRTRSREPVSFLLSFFFQTTYPYPSLPHYSSLSLPSSTICPSSAKYFMEEIGNICFVLPKPRNGKNPEVYNYIGNDSDDYIKEKKKNGDESGIILLSIGK